MNNIDKRNKLEEKPFSYQVKKKTIFLEFRGKRVKVLKGEEAEKFLERMHALKDEKEEQFLLAKVTGNFKRGNERRK